MRHVSCTNARHDVKDLVNHGMVENTKILNLFLRRHILWSYHIVAKVTFNAEDKAILFQLTEYRLHYCCYYYYYHFSNISTTPLKYFLQISNFFSTKTLLHASYVSTITINFHFPRLFVRLENKIDVGSNFREI